ncbi:MAG: phenylalanine--tRNA ligase subunit alpha [Candidatus Eisenbacteria bacterium]|nr:phenylalanine--tRNA ligase subunit alpha [Candidatus Eisenbacteria bacterium]
MKPAGAGVAAFYDRAARGIAGAPDLAELKERHTRLLGRERGIVTGRLAGLPELSPEERRQSGRALNLIKRWLTELEAARRSALEREQESRSAQGLDVTLPGRKPWIGHRHVLAQIQEELLDLFHGLGYSVYVSPEVESDDYNFGKLNFPPDHPARDAHDTYWVDGGLLLRTHTSPGWVRAMEERQPPLRLVFPGRVFRAEQVDASHMDQFHQVDGLFVDRDVSMADLKATLNTFARSIYGRAVRTRLVPVYFPFVEPGAQLDVACVICDGSGRVRDARCPVCKGGGWIELLGAGMVHPNVFRAVGYDPEAVTGFAFGMGLERIAMMRWGIPEIRLFLENDLRFLNQF